MSLGPDEYIKVRLDQQIDWYDKKSMQAQRNYKLLQRIEIIAAALIPVFVGFISEWQFFEAIIVILGAVVVITSSFTKLGKFHENWLQYRQTCELLKHEKYLYLTATNPYEEQNFQLLVERVESIISAENVNWSQLATMDDKK